MLSIFENVFLYGALILYVIITEFWTYKISPKKDCSQHVDLQDTFEPVNTSYSIESVFLDVKQPLQTSERFEFERNMKKLDKNNTPADSSEMSLVTNSTKLNENRKFNNPFLLYYESELSNEQDLFFEQLFQSINESIVDEKPIESSNMDTLVWETDEASDDMLSMEAWNSEPVPMEDLKQLAIAGTSKINEHLLGEQQWIVEVVGEEQGYLHVSDGSGRAWIDFNAYNGMVSKKDKLLVHVNRITDVHVELVHAEMLQQHSLDFCMTEELDYFVSEDVQEAISA